LGTRPGGGTDARRPVSNRDEERRACGGGAAEIDISNADWLRAVLREAAACGQATFVVDMTGTQFCASAGVGVLVRAH
jgi:hypothetical protein